MKFTLIIFSLILGAGLCENFLNTPIHDCVKCLCHSVSGCYIRQNCAKYSISLQYWMDASSPVVDIDDDPRSMSSYEKCMKDENCIVETIYKYTEISRADCNCDNTFDCKDRLAIHLSNGNSCLNPMFGKVMSNRFNTCRMMMGGLNTDAMEEREDRCMGQFRG